MKDNNETNTMNKPEGVARISVKTPDGYIIVEPKDTDGNYPGVYIWRSLDGIHFDEKDIVACVEFSDMYVSLMIETYLLNEKQPVSIIRHDDGEQFAY